MSWQGLRVRFAPSPTGYLHIGGARTALFNFLIARKHKGSFILRIEDTDRERSTPESIQAILDGMQWLGLTWDEGPFYQSQRDTLYQEYIDKLITQGAAYACFCTPELLETKRVQAQNEKRKFMYDRTCYKLPPETVAEKIKQGVPHCWRFLSPNAGQTKVHDLIRGDIFFDNKELDDLVIRRSDASPTYNLSVAIDDATMGITHVLRGDDHLNNTPRQIQIYQALGLEPPQFAHLPMILGADKKRLSKRHGATSVMAYKEMGYLPEAMINYLARLGWSHGDEEFFTMADLIAKFDTAEVGKSSGIFNPEKLAWLNGLHIRAVGCDHLAPLVKEFLHQAGLTVDEDNKLKAAIQAALEKVTVLTQFVDMIGFAFRDQITIPQDLKSEMLTLDSSQLIKKLAQAIARVPTLDHETLEKIFHTLTEQLDIKLGKIAQPARLALTGSKVSVGIHDCFLLLGKEKSLERLQQAIA